MAGGTDNDNELLTDIPEAQDQQEMAQASPQKPLTVDISDPTFYQTQQPQAQPMQADVVPPPPMPGYVGPSYDEKMAEHMKTMQDAAAGHISPQTYSQLYGNKDTLGKIGTLFGLLVSGAGSGLAHQSNMVMDMMDKQIQRDFESQKQNVDNGRNFVSLQYQHNLQQAQQAEHYQHVLDQWRKGIPNAAMTQKFMKKLGVPGADDFLNDYMRQQQQVMAPFEGLAKTYGFTGHHINMLAQKSGNPQTIAVGQAINEKTQEKAQQALAQGAQQAAAIPKPSSMMDANPVNQDALNEARMYGDWAAKNDIPWTPGMIKPEDYASIQSEIGDLGKNRKTAALINDSFNKIASMGALAGQVPGADMTSKAIAAITGVIPGNVGKAVSAVGDTAKDAFERQRQVQISALKGRGFDDEEITNMVPSWLDFKKPEKLAEVHRKAMDKLKAKEVTPYLDSYNSDIPGLKSDFPEYHIAAHVKDKKKGK